MFITTFIPIFIAIIKLYCPWLPQIVGRARRTPRCASRIKIHG